MTESQALWLIGGLLVFAAIVVGALAQLTEKISRVERQNDRQLEMLIALLQKNGINPVTLS